MLAVITKLLPAARNFSRQIVPPVVATLIAALLIAGFNRAFSGHLMQPRMAAMHDGTGKGTRPIVYATNPQEAVAVAEVDPLAEPAIRERIFAKGDAKGDARESGKDQAAFKLATAPVAPRAVARRTEPVEARPAEPQRVASVPVVVSAPPAPAPAMTTAPITAQPIAPIAQQPIASQPIAPPMAPQPLPQPTAQPPMAQQPMPAPQMAAPQIGVPVAQEPPPVIAAKPMVTVPDRPRAPYPANTAQNYPNQAYPASTYPNRAYPNPAYPNQANLNQANPNYDPRPPYAQQQADDEDYARPRERRPLERFVDAIKPSTIFNHMREFGDRIEAAGNEILPSIRQ